MKLETMRKRGMGEDGLEEKAETYGACAEACHLPAITHAVTGPGPGGASRLYFSHVAIQTDRIHKM